MKNPFYLLSLPLLLSSLSSCGEQPSSSQEGTSASQEAVSVSQEGTSISLDEPSISREESPVSQGEIDEFKALLAKQDLSPILTKMFVADFIQNYDVFSASRDEDESETRFYSYRGGGSFGCFYEVDEASYEEVEELENHDFFDYLSRGKGSYGMLQTAALISYHHETVDGEVSKLLNSLNFLQRLETNFGEENVQVYNALKYTEDIDDSYDYDHQQQFNGIINKGTLFETVTPRAFSDVIARTNLYDGQRTCESLDRIYFDLLGQLSEKSDKELGEFIANNAITLEEGEDTTSLHFKVGDEDLFELLSENEVIPGEFEGTLTYEKESGKFTAFDYRITYLDNESGEGEDHIHTAAMEFSAEGYSWNQRFDRDLYIEPNPTVYEDAETFLNDVVNEVIPPLF